MTRLIALASVSIVAAVGGPSVASASVTIGGDIAVTGAPVQCDPGGGTICEIAQLSLAGAQTQAPFNGVVVRWRVNGASGPLALRVLRTAAGFNHTFASTSALGTPATTGVATFPTRQPIHGGDHVGIEVGPSSEVSSTAPSPAGASAAVWPGTPDGSAAAPLVTGDAVFAYNADVEPDADVTALGMKPRTSARRTRARRGRARLPRPRWARRRRPTRRRRRCPHPGGAPSSRSAARSPSSSCRTRMRPVRPSSH